ncbi:MAG: rhodanese-like domain-containing protein [Lacisediminimonas sp.]|nr:rhodanese-like domain-containing protein [Lacisediminimonas sp.]
MVHRFSSVSDQVVQAIDLLATENINRLFVDVRLGDAPLELENYRECHIFGAVHGQIRDVFAAQPSATSGNLPLPGIDALKKTLDGWGVDADTEVVVYGPSLALAARAWWVLRWAGLDHVKVLDGGLKAWINNGGAVASGDAVPRLRPSKNVLTLSPGNMPTISVAEVECLDPDSLLIDARDEASYLAGCIPRAVNLPASLQWTPASTLRTTGEITQLYTDTGVAPGSNVVVYCGGGVLSALAVLTMSALEVTPRLFVGSWSEWNKCPLRMARSANGGTSI